MNSLVPRSPGDLARSGYSEEEIYGIYALACMLLENGSLKQAETILMGLAEVVPEFAPVLLALAYVRGQDGNYDSAQSFAEQALRIDAESPEAMLYLITFLLTTGDLQSAGTYLGEIADRIESNQIQDPVLIRFFRAQMVRYQAREG